MPKVLVVDDATGVHDMLRTLFATMDIEDAYACSGAEALKIYENGNIDIVLSDVRMEQMDGIVLLRRLKKIDPNAVVIMMTALDRKDDILAALKLGAFDFFIKPFLVNEFKESIRRAFEERRRRMAPVLDTAPAPAQPIVPPADVEKLRLLRRKLEEREAALNEREKHILGKDAVLVHREQSLAAKAQELEEQAKAIQARSAEISSLEQQLTQRAQTTPLWQDVAPAKKKKPAPEDDFGDEFGDDLADDDDAGSLSAEDDDGGFGALDDDFDPDALGDEFGDEELIRKPAKKTTPALSADIRVLQAELEEMREILLEKERELQDKDQQISQLTAMNGGSSSSEWDDDIMGLGISAKPAAVVHGPATDASLAAREAAIREKEELLAEREAFLEQSENALFDKGQQLQELETELDQRRDFLEARENSSGGGGGGGISSADQAEILRIKEEIEAKARDLAEREHRLKERERDLKRAEALIKAREQYLKASESILFNSGEEK